MTRESLCADRIGLLLIRLGQWVTKRGLRLSKPGRQW